MKVQKMGDKMFCRICGTKMEERDIYCPRCGWKIESSNSTTDVGCVKVGGKWYVHRPGF